MAIETNCPGCSRRLRVADQHAGKTARCPGCQTLYTIPFPESSGQSAPATPESSWNAEGRLAATTGSTNSPSSPTLRWRLRTEDGKVYGPVERAELDGWVAQGRVTAAAQLQQDGDANWREAALIYPALSRTASVTPAASPFAAHPQSANPFADHPQPADPYAPASYAPSSYAPNAYMAPGGRRYGEAHRGGLVLAMGIMGWVFGCPVFGPIALILGIVDLRKMRDGRMDPSGKGLTIAGLVLGVVHTVLMVGFLLLIALAAVLE